MSDLQKVSQALWDLFVPEIQSGGPVYFSFSEYVISSEVASALSLASTQEGLNAFLEITRSLVIPSGTKVRLKPEIFSKTNGRSNVILLIALQVLAVEHMSKRSGLYTQAAYFPPLRELLGSDLGHDSSLPFVEKEFDELWQTFKEEILSINPSSFITFDLVGKGVNTNRIYPLSQALLNQEDLIILATSFNLQGRKLGLEKDADFNWRTFLISNSRRLSRRGASCCVNEILRSPITEQLKNFLQNFNQQDIINLEERIKKVDKTFRISLFESSDDSFFGIEQSLHQIIYGKDDSALLGTEGVLRVIHHFSRKPYLVLRSIDGAFRGDPKLNFEELIDNICFISPDSTFISYVESTLGISNLSIKQREITSCSQYNMYYIDDGRCKNLQLSVLQGVISVSASQSKLQFVGGLRIDFKGQNFFTNYPPEKLVYNGRSLSDSDDLLVNNKKMKWGEFLALLNGNFEISYTLKYANESISLNLRKGESNSIDVGYPIKNNSIFKKKVGFDDREAGVIGFRLINFKEALEITRKDFLNFFVPENNFFEHISSEQINFLINSIKLCRSLGSAQKNYMILSLITNSKAPSSLMKRVVKVLGEVQNV